MNGLHDVVAVAGGDDSKLALKSDGTAWSWGTWDSPWTPPVPVPNLAGVIRIARGWAAWDGGKSLALTGDGSVWEWYPPWTSTNMSQMPPSRVALPRSKSIATGCDGDALAVAEDGTVWEWDYRDESASVYVAAPVRVPTLSGVTAISGNCAGNLAANSEGIWTWSHFTPGIARTWQTRTPFWTSSLSDIAMLATGQSHTIALRNDGTVWAVGNNYSGQLGDGTTVSRDAFVQVGGLRDVVAVAGGGNHSLAVTRDGAVWAWGANYHGQLGVPTLYSAPLRMPQPGGPRLSIAVTHAGTFAVGRLGVYTLTVTNDGSAAATGTITVTDNLPPGLRYVSAAGTGWVCSAEESLVTCAANGPLGRGDSRSVTLTVDIAAGAWPGITNVATVAHEGDLNLENNRAAEWVVVSPAF